MRSLRYNPLPLLITCGALVRLAIAWSPISWLLTHVVPDDAFYYFTIARNITRGMPPTFDGINATNGFHPFWMGAILPIFAVIPDRVPALHVVLTLCAIIDSASIYLLIRIVRERGVSNAASLIVGAMYAFSPLLLTHAGPMNGLESSINILILLLYIRLYLGVVAAGVAAGMRPVALAACTLLLFLARTDNIVIIAVTYAHMLIASRRRPGEELKRIAAAGAAAACCALPWLLWSYAEFGSIVQVSGRSMAYVAWDYAMSQGWSLLRYAQQYLANVGELLRYIPFPQLFLTKYSPLFGGVLLLAVGALIWLRRLARGSGRRSTLTALVAPIIITIGLYFLVHTMRAVFMRSWYYLPFVPLLLILMAHGLDLIGTYFSGRPAGTRIASITAASIVTAAAYAIGITNALGMESRDGMKYRIAMQMNRILPPRARVGAWNAGIYGYFFERGEVVNLDGVVNDGAYRHIRDHSLGDYCRAQGITYLVDDASSLEAMAIYWNHHTGSIARYLQVIHALPIPMTTDTTIIGRMDGRGVLGSWEFGVGSREEGGVPSDRR